MHVCYFPAREHRTRTLGQCACMIRQENVQALHCGYNNNTHFKLNQAAQQVLNFAILTIVQCCAIIVHLPLIVNSTQLQITKIQ